MGSLFSRVARAGEALFDSEVAKLEAGVRETSREIQAESRSFSQALGAARDALGASAQRYLQAQVRARLAEIRLEDLKDRLPKRIRLGVLADAGVETLADVAARGGAWSLQRIPGVGENTASALYRAYEAFQEAEWLRGAPVPRPPARTDDEASLLAAAANIARCRQELELHLPRIEQALAALDSQLKRDRTGVFAALENLVSGQGSEEAKAELRDLERRLEALKASADYQRILTARRALLTEPGLLKDPARGFDLLSGLFGDIASIVSRKFHELGVREEDTGSLPQQLARAVEAFPLHEGLRARELRPYQAFGAKYLLLQERTLLGDDMGLGKTSQALAAFVHCHHREQARLFLVVCPAGVVGNWMREADQYTPLQVFRLHGAGREAEVGKWLRGGGIAVTSYGTLGALSLPRRLVQAGRKLDFVVADEAHYLKNPDSDRSFHFGSVAGSTRRLSLMTGTPLENHPRELLNLLELVQPELARELSGGPTNLALGVPNPVRMLQQIAPAYLRRNRKEVLHELPEETVTDEGVEIPWGERLGYWSVLQQERRGGGLHALRQFLMVGDGSQPTAKMKRLLEILEDYRRDGFKVVVFSYYRQVLETLEAHVGERFRVVGTLTGSVSDLERQRLIDRLGQAQGTAVLLSQIEAGGVGLNMQCANVCVLAEPQWKPSTELQAIARLSRMGQERPVFVHRLVAADTVDERLEEILARKGTFFQLYAGTSAVADASHEAKEAVWSKQILDYELKRMEELKRQRG